MTRERAAGLDPTDHRSRDSRFASPQIEEYLQLVAALQAIAERSSHSVAELAIAWALRRTEVTAADWHLAPEELEQIDHLLLKHSEK
jgi:aryl-alcohol dehydrogenase-like predicted oxidoreductase